LITHIALWSISTAQTTSPFSSVLPFSSESRLAHITLTSRRRFCFCL